MLSDLLLRLGKSQGCYCDTVLSTLLCVSAISLRLCGEIVFRKGLLSSQNIFRFV